MLYQLSYTPRSQSGRPLAVAAEPRKGLPLLEACRERGAKARG
jgi:hypothetical protein